METDGYVLMRGGVSRYITRRLTRFLRRQLDIAARPIFNYGDEQCDEDDGKRNQVELVTSSNTPLQQLHGAVHNIVHETTSPRMQLQNWVCIQSNPGCQRQAMHCDLPPDSNHEKLQSIGVLVAIEFGTSMWIWPGSHRLHDIEIPVDFPPIPAVQVHMEPGDVLCFRGDLIHAGAAYVYENIRLHAYGYMPSAPRIRNKTWPMKRYETQLVQWKQDILQIPI